MKLSEHLKQLKAMSPDEGYARRSRMQIVGVPMEVRPRLTAWSFLMHNLQIGSAIALTALLLVVGFGGFSAWKMLSPFRLASLDVTNLQAEANAVNDIQVRLDGIAYTESPAHITSTIPKAVLLKKVTSGTKTVPSPDNATATQKSLSIDEALDLLSQ